MTLEDLSGANVDPRESARLQSLPEEKVGATAKRAAAWSLIQICGERATQAGVFILTARLLGPADFGRAAVAVAPALIANYALQGITQAVIQREDTSPSYLSACLACAIGTSVLMAMLIFAAAPMVSSAVGDPLVGELMRVSALAPAFTGVGLVPEGILSRQFSFAVLAVRRPLAIFTGGGLSIVLAYWGAGPWSIIAQTLLAAAIGSLVCLVAFPATSWSRFSRLDWQNAWSNSAKLMARLVLEVAGQRLPEIALGLLAGPSAAGLFRLAKAILDLVTSVLFYPISAGLLPVFARLSSDPRKLETLVRNISVASVVFICAPALGFSVFSVEITRMTLGPAWAPAADIMMSFAFALPVLGMVAAISPFMIATQQANTLLQCSAAQLLAAMVLVSTGALWDVVLASFGFSLSLCLGAGMLWFRFLARCSREDVRLLREATSLVILMAAWLTVVFLFRGTLVAGWFSVATFATSITLYILIVTLFFPRLGANALQTIAPGWRDLRKGVR